MQSPMIRQCACSEEERLRIEAKNPNPKMPLVRYVGGTWRVGGILALSRAFGDAYMKSSLQFEGLRASSDGYSSGFGVIAEPDTSLVELTGVAPGPLILQYHSHCLRVHNSCCLHNKILSVYSMVMLQSPYDSSTSFCRRECCHRLHRVKPAHAHWLSAW